MDHYTRRKEAPTASGAGETPHFHAIPSAFLFEPRETIGSRYLGEGQGRSSPIAVTNARLVDRMVDLARTLAGAEPTLVRHTEHRFRSRGSLVVQIGGRRQGAWFDHEAGCGGDPLGLVRHLRHLSSRDALSWAVAWLGGATVRDARPVSLAKDFCRSVEHDSKAWSRNLARRLWQEGQAPIGTLAETYLLARALALPTDAPIRFHPSAWRNTANGPDGPAMLALMTSPEDNRPVGLHLTYIAANGRGKAAGPSAKVMLGEVGVVRLVPDEQVITGLGLAEGIETSLATMQRIGWHPIWAATSAGAIARFPVLPGIEALTIFADADEAGLRAARACVARWADAGRTAKLIRPPAGDWDDITRGRAVE